jgi:hypothetical protein
VSFDAGISAMWKNKYLLQNRDEWRDWRNGREFNRVAVGRRYVEHLRGWRAKRLGRRGFRARFDGFYFAGTS